MADTLRCGLQEGVIQLSHTGIGRYEETEAVIQRLLQN